MVFSLLNILRRQAIGMEEYSNLVEFPVETGMMNVDLMADNVDEIVSVLKCERVPLSHWFKISVSDRFFFLPFFIPDSLFNFM